MNVSESRDAIPVRTSEANRTLRRWLGAQLYPRLSRWLDPSRKYAQFDYAPLLAKLVRDGATWLDAGCGHQALKLNTPSEESEIITRARIVVGCDLSLEALRNHRTIRNTVRAGLDSLPFGDAMFDVISLNYVVEHLSDPHRIFTELARLLKPSGTLVMVTPNARGYFVRLTRLGRKLLPESFVRRFIYLREYRSEEDIFPTFYRANSRNDLHRLMEGVGLAEVSFQMVNDPAVFNFVAPLAFLELLFGRLLSFFDLRELKAGTIIAVYCRSREQPCAGYRQEEGMTDVISISGPHEVVR